MLWTTCDSKCLVFILCLLYRIHIIQCIRIALFSAFVTVYLLQHLTILNCIIHFLFVEAYVNYYDSNTLSRHAKHRLLPPLGTGQGIFILRVASFQG